MSVAEFNQPDNTTQDAASYKASIDAAIKVLMEIAANFAPHEAATPDLTVIVDAGKLWDGQTYIAVSQQISAAFVAPSTNPRIDRIALNLTDGALVVIPGTEAATPAAPDYGVEQYPLCQVAIAVGQTEILNTNITDDRPLINGVAGLQNKTDATAAPTVNDDINAGYRVGSFWVDVNANESYRCVDAAIGAAVWVNTTMDSTDVAAIYAPLASAALTGTPTAPTPAEGDNTTKIATTEYADRAAAAGGGVTRDGILQASVTKWTHVETPLDKALYGIDYGEDTFIAVGIATGTEPYAVRSHDGIHWEKISTGLGNYDLNDVCYSPKHKMWVAVGMGVTSNGYIITSTDNGETWTTRQPAGVYTWEKVKFLNGIFIAVGSSGWTCTSTDGITWTAIQSNVVTQVVWDVIYDGSQYVLCGTNDVTDMYLATSTDAVNWTEVANNIVGTGYALLWDNVNQQYLVGTSSQLLKSTNLTTWTVITQPASQGFYAIGFNGHMYVIVGFDDFSTGDAELITSLDTVTWTEQVNPEQRDLYDVIYAKSMWVAVGRDTGTTKKGYILISGIG